MEASYDYNFWTVAHSKFPDKRISAQRYMDEVLVECPEAKLIECINLDNFTYVQFAWGDNTTGAVVVERGHLILDKSSQLAGSVQRQEGPDFASPEALESEGSAEATETAV